MTENDEIGFTDSEIQVMSDVVRDFEEKLHDQMSDQPTADQYVRGLSENFTRKFTPDEQMMFIRDIVDIMEETKNKFLHDSQLVRVNVWLETVGPEMRVYYQHLTLKNIALVE